MPDSSSTAVAEIKTSQSALTMDSNGPLEAAAAEPQDPAFTGELAIETNRLTEPALDPSEWVRDSAFSVFDEQFAYEPIDESWAGRTEPRVWTGLSSSGLNYSAVQTQCRSTLCRVKVTHATPIVTEDEQERMLQALQSFFRITIGDQGPPTDIVAAKAHGIIDDQGREVDNVTYFFRVAPGPPSWWPSPSRRRPDQQD